MKIIKNQENKLLVFDIDGTLLFGRGVPKDVFLTVVRRRFPEYSQTSDFHFSGLTDPQIAQKLLVDYIGAQQDKTTFIAAVLQEFLEELEKKITPENPPLVLPGVRRLPDFWQQSKRSFLGLVTGNMQRGAEIKLSACQLHHYFPVGAFGSDSPDRNLLPPMALQRAEAFYGVSFSKEIVRTIGDSIYDVRCARVNSLRSLAVASGMTAKKTLSAEKPDFVIDDLSATGHVLSVLGLA